MLFGSYEFIFIFAPIVILGYYLLNIPIVWLTAASLAFYALQDVKSLPILVSSIILNYLLCYAIVRLKTASFNLKRVSVKDNKLSSDDSNVLLSAQIKSKEKLTKFIFIAGVIFNIAFLAFFKYTIFLVENLNYLGFNISIPYIHLPVGVSFFTITQIVCLVDFYQGVTKDKRFLNYALFVSFFPHVLSGPIYWHKPMVKQFNDIRDEDVSSKLREKFIFKTRHVNWENMARGLTLFVIGLSKKVLIADAFSRYVSENFANPQILTLLDSWASVIFFTIQLYFDFSGYSDMVVGIAQMMSIKIPVNFNSPYKAHGIIDFWSRWHMSLTTTITNYIYTPMVRACKNITFTNAMIATFLSMVISGLWHGAGWTYVIFGSLHGLGLVINHVWKKKQLWMPKFLGWFFTMALVLIANVFFRAGSVSDAIDVLSAMIGLKGVIWFDDIVKICAVLGINLAGKAVHLSRYLSVMASVSLFCIFLCPNSNQITKAMKPNILWVIPLVFIFYFLLFELGAPAEFIYFQF